MTILPVEAPPLPRVVPVDAVTFVGDPLLMVDPRFSVDPGFLADPVETVTDLTVGISTLKKPKIFLVTLTHVETEYQ